MEAINGINTESGEDVQIPVHMERLTRITEQGGELILQYQNGAIPHKDITNGVFENFRIELLSEHYSS